MQDPINILIVDDEPKNLTVLETVLDDPAYRLVRAESADQAPPTSGDVAAGIYAAAGSAVANAKAAPDPLWCPHKFAARSEPMPASRARGAGS